MAGSATLTTVASRKTTIEPKIVATSVSSCWRDTPSSLGSGGDHSGSSRSCWAGVKKLR